MKKEASAPCANMRRIDSDVKYALKKMDNTSSTYYEVSMKFNSVLYIFTF